MKHLSFQAVSLKLTAAFATGRNEARPANVDRIGKRILWYSTEIEEMSQRCNFRENMSTVSQKLEGISTHSDISPYLPLENPISYFFKK